MYITYFRLHGAVAVTETVNTFLWLRVGLPLLMIAGVLLTYLLRGFQVTRLPHWMSRTIGSTIGAKTVRRIGKNGSISQFQAMCTALAASLGVGNIAGVAAAILTGGPGAVFWMWIAALLGMATGFAENVLGVYYRRRRNGHWLGGAMYYLRDGIGHRWGRTLAGAFACCTALASLGMGNAAQVNQIVLHITEAFPAPALSSVTVFRGVSLYALLIGGVLTALVAVALLGGLPRIAALTEKLVPTMVILFTLGTLTVIAVNHARIGNAFSAILRNAFCANALWGGATGITLRQVIVQGYKRGTFSHEAGLGSSVAVHAVSDTCEPVQQGMWSLFEVFIDTIVICTLTALVILTGGVIDLSTGATVSDGNGTALVAAAFCGVFGTAGKQFVAIAVLLFAFSTILGWSQCGAAAAEYLGGSTLRRIHQALFVGMTLCGAGMTSSLAWNISDIFNGLMMIPNLVGVLLLSGEVRAITQNYIDRTIKHKKVAPLLSYDTRIQKQMEPFSQS